MMAFTGLGNTFRNIAGGVKGATKQIFTKPIEELGHIVKGGSHGANVNIPELSGHMPHWAEVTGETIGTAAHSLQHALHHSQGALHAMANHLPYVAHAGHALADFAPAAQLVPHGLKFASLARDTGLGNAVKSIFI